VAVGFVTATVFNDDGASVPSCYRLLFTTNYYEVWLDQAAPPTYLPNLRSAATARKWLTTRRNFPQIGEKELPRGANGQFLWYAPLPNAFDALFYLHETSASQPYRSARPAW
jgi:hypothetical protein